MPQSVLEQEEDTGYWSCGPAEKRGGIIEDGAEQPGEAGMTRRERFLWYGYTYEQMVGWKAERERMRQEREG